MLRSRLPSVSAGGIYGKGLFGREMGPLQDQLRHGEYDLLKFAPMLESDFVQISKRGEVIDVHNQIQTVTVAVACTSPSLLVPNVLLLARPLFPPEEPPTKLKSFFHPRHPAKRYELTRISIHNPEKKQLRFKLASGRTFYLQLCPQPSTQEDIFGLWIKVVNMLRPPSDLSIKSHRKTKHETSKSKSPAGSLNVEEKVSEQSVYLASETPSLIHEEVTSRQSLIMSMESLPSSQGPSWSPIASEEKIFDFDGYPLAEGRRSPPQPFERPPSRKSRGSRKERAGSTASSNRKTSKSGRANRKKSARKDSSRKSSKILSLISFCSWGNRRRSKSRGKGKKR
ncbi:Golgi-associated RAB2B interactor protein 3-like isoform X2 [Pantherophis guttatus]|uniref:Golgi-associated RAB2B interactor protein 3-like isoform X2 n=1 Tax=Pantherophis guttatus TaxID=94885 RepID=A0A6P9BK27_PANGU|nr:Golgi-associated RAB2B interactor protein 3-like isoform X2 [Pantherophis guttatus]